MPAPIVSVCRLCFGVLLGALLLQGPVRADDVSDFHAALTGVSDQYNVALTTLETAGQDETAAQVQRLRIAWQDVVDRFGPHRPEAFANDDNYVATLLDIDVRLIGVLLIIDMGNRDAARSSLKAIQAMIADL